jgi:hypothetical protein
MDILSEVLQAVRLKGAIYFDVNPSEPWTIATPAMKDIQAKVMPGAEHVIGFHVMVTGKCWVEIAEPAFGPLHVEAGDIILVPRGDPHLMGSISGGEATPNMGLYYKPTDQSLPF